MTMKQLKNCEAEHTSNSDRPSTSLSASIANDVSAQTESNQMDIVPVATGKVHQPNQEVPEVMADIRYAVSCGVVS